VSYTIGQQAVLTTSVKVGDVPTNATMALTVTAPDGTVSHPTISQTGTGEYSATVTLDQASIWTYEWTSSGAAVGTDDGVFYVTTSAARIISLKELKLHLNKDPDLTIDDGELADVLDAAQDMITDRIGPVIPTIYTDRFSGGRAAVALSRRPVISVTSVFENVNTGSPTAVASTGYGLDGATGILTRLSTAGAPVWWSGGFSSVAVTYTVGRSPVPQNIRLAAKELAAHLWRNSQIGRARRQRSSADDESSAGLGYSMPYRVRELLGRTQYWVY
jgi:hypothetical protein